MDRWIPQWLKIILDISFREVKFYDVFLRQTEESTSFGTHGKAWHETIMLHKIIEEKIFDLRLLNVDS